MKFTAFSILSLFVLSPAFSGCGGNSGGGNSPTAAVAPAPVNVAGTWRGPVTSTVAGSITATLRLNQYSSNNTAINGTYATSDGGSTPIAGNIHGTTANFTITKTGPGCSGSYSGAGIVTIFPNGVKTMGYNSSVASNPACVGNESVIGNLIFASYSGPS
jgi:hypothetical protein